MPDETTEGHEDSTRFTSQHTFLDLIEDPELGATELELKLNVRQVACIQFVLGCALDQGMGVMLGAALARKLGPEFAESFALEFDSAQARIGMTMSDALGEPEHALEQARNLAVLDQQRGGS